jgi:predicted metal-binding membrane protein
LILRTAFGDPHIRIRATRASGSNAAMPVELLSGFLRYPRAIVSGALGGVIAASWAYLWLGGGQIMTMPSEWSEPYAALIFVMWVVMMVAMMLPGAAPTVLLVTTLASDRTANSKLVPATAMLFASGYLLVWCGFSLAATSLQWGFDEAGLLSKTMAFGNETSAGAVLIAAGIYEWTPLKDACLKHCHSPTEFLVRHWRQGALGAVLTGMRHGIFCLGLLLAVNGVAVCRRTDEPRLGCRYRAISAAAKDDPKGWTDKPADGGGVHRMGLCQLG